MNSRSQKVLNNCTGQVFLHRPTSIDSKYIFTNQLSDNAYLMIENNRTTVITRQVNKEVVSDKTDADSIEVFDDYINDDIRNDVPSESRVISEILNNRDITTICVSPFFPSYVTKSLEEENIRVEVMSYDPIEAARITKTDDEVEKIREIQDTTEDAMQKVHDIISSSTVNDSGELVYNSEVLTSEYVKNEVIEFLDSKNATIPEGLIVASGPESHDPHESGSGPIREGEPIVCDIFPESNTGYFGDMTRTFVKGQMPKDLKKMYNTVELALEEAVDMIHNGADGSEVHMKVEDIISEKGFSVSGSEGFIHSTGHGIGLELHELPSINSDCDELEENMILTVEPGIYKSDIGGVRIEDAVRVTEEGFENLNEMSWSTHSL